MIDPVSAFTVLTSLIPTFSYAAKRIVDYNTGGNKPVNAEEYAEARKADAQVLEVINKTPDNISPWVANIIALQRPIAIGVILLNWSFLTAYGMAGGKIDLQLYVITANLASSAVFYLFGDRSLMYSLQTLNRKLTGAKE